MQTARGGQKTASTFNASEREAATFGHHKLGGQSCVQRAVNHSHLNVNERPCSQFQTNYATRTFSQLFQVLSALTILANCGALSPPERIQVDSVTEDSVTISWSPVLDAEAYQIQSAFSLDAPFEILTEEYAAPLEPPNNFTTISNLVTGRPLLLTVTPGTARGDFGFAPSVTIRATPLGPPEEPVRDLSILSYDEASVVLAWVQPGSSPSSGPAASHFAVLSSCGGDPLELYPAVFTALQASISPPGGWTIGSTCDFQVASRNLNYDPSDPWSGQISTILRLTLQGPPGSVIALQASDSTINSITISWTFGLGATGHRVSYAPVDPPGDGQAVVFTTDFTLDQVEVTGLEFGALYDFTVETRNLYAAGYQAASSVQVRVEGPPSAPVVSIDAVSATEVTVSWVPPSSTHTLSYQVRYESAAVGVKVVPTSLTQSTSPSLEEGAEVRISVRAVNLLAPGPWSNLTVTPLAAPGSPPALVSLRLPPAESEQRLNLSWAAVPLADRFRIERQEENEAFEAVAEVGAQLEAAMTGLTALTTYTFRVFAGNLAGFETVGMQSNSLQTAPVDQPALPVANLTVAGVTATSVRLEWAEPAGPRITAVQIVQSEEGSGLPLTTELLASSGPSFNASGLSRGVSYRFVVLARSANREAYNGVPNATVVTRTVERPSMAVSGLAVVGITDSSATLAWEPVTAETVTRYRVQGVDQDNVSVPEREAAQPADASSLVQFEVTGLTAASVYSFTVTARNLNVKGYGGVPSSVLAGVEIIGLPAPVDNLRVAALTASAVTLAWDPSPLQPRAFQFQVAWRSGAQPFASGGLGPTEALFQTVRGLTRGASFDFKVFAGNLAGFERQGSGVVAAAPVAQPLPVESVRVTEITDETISLEWSPALFPEAVAFRVQAGAQVADTAATSFVVTGLTTGVRTQFAVFARSFNSRGFEQLGVSALVTPIDAPALVTTLEVEGVTTTAVRLRFDAAQLENVTRFKVQVKRTTSAEFSDLAEYQCRVDEQFLETPPLCDTAFAVADLVTDVSYDFRVLQRNSNAKGYLDGGNVVSARPVFKPTRAATNVRVAGVTTSAVFLTFDPPVGQDRPTHYRVVYSRAGNFSELVSDEFPAGAGLVVNVSGLEQDVEYELQLIGRNLNVEGYQDALRSAVLVAAPVARPGQVQSLRITELSSSSVGLAWDPPVDPVLSYHVEVANKTVVVNGVRTDILVLGLAPDFQPLGQTAELQFQAASTAAVLLPSNLPMLLSVRAANINIEGFSDRALITASPTPAPEGSPTSLQVQRVTASSVSFSWLPPEDFQPGDDSVTKYRIEGCRLNCGSADPFPAVAETGDKYYILGGAEFEWRGTSWDNTGVTFWRELAVVPVTTMQYNVTQIDSLPLLIGEGYEFRVSAGNLNTIGYGPASNLGPVFPAFLPGPPREIVISNPKNDRFALNFIAPLLLNGTGEPTTYRVLVLDLVSNLEFESPDLLINPFAVLLNMLPGTTYQVRVFAGNLAGFEPVGALSSGTVRTTAQPCTRVCCASAAAASCTSTCCGLLVRRAVAPYIELVWTAPDNLALLQYKVGYRLGGSTASYTAVGTTYTNRVVIGPLDFTAVEYQMQVAGGQRSTDSFDRDELSAYIRVKTAPDEPFAFDIVTVNVTVDSVLLEWERPVDLALMMEVRYGVELSTDDFAYDALNNTRLLPTFVDSRLGDTVTYLVTGLQTSQPYSFRVLAKTPYVDEFQDGVQSSVVRVAPLAQPDPVENLRIIEVTETSVLLTWDVPTDTPITTYRLSWDGLSVEFDGALTVWNVTNLTSVAAYTFELEARNFNVNGYGAAAVVVGGPEGLPLKPIGARLVQYLSDSAEVSWELQSEGSAVLSVQVQCRVAEDPALDGLLSATAACLSGPIAAGAPFIPALDLPPARRFAQLSGLGAGYSYQVRVCARGANVLGITEQTCSDYLDVTPDGPPPPVVLRLSSVTTDSATLSWAAPEGVGSSWSFVPGRTQPGYDISCPGGSVAELQAACEDVRTCEGFSTDGCLKSRIGRESEWAEYVGNSSAVGECCQGAESPAGRGCAGAGEELEPKPTCGCQCRGLFKKNLQYLLQLSAPPEPFANIFVAGSDRFETRVSRRAGCDDCAACPADCVTVPGLAMKALHQFRVFARSLNGLGYSSDSSNILDATPVEQPATPVADLRLLYTFDRRAVLAWTGISDEPVTAYALEASLDGAAWGAAGPLADIALDEVPHADGEVTGGASLLQPGTTYWFRVRARNLNSEGYAGVPASDGVQATPFDVIDNLQQLAVPAVTACVTADCCDCCAANLCRGVGTVELTWLMPAGPVTHFRIQIADVDAVGAIGEYRDYSDTVPAAATSASVTGLLIGQLYAFKVQAGSTNFFVYSQDCTPLSAPDADCPAVVVASPYTRPTTSVQGSLRSTVVTATSLRLHFDAIASEPVTRYRIAYGTQLLSPAETAFAELTHTSGPMQAYVDGLQPGQAYFVSVTPRNLNALGYAACPTTADVVVSEVLGPGTYRVTWQAPVWDPPITSYRVWYQRDDGAVPTLYGKVELASSGAELALVLDGLDPAASFTFVVTPDAAPCAVLGPVVPLPQPSLVEQFRVVSVTSTTVSTQWEAPHRLSGTPIASLFVLSVANSSADTCAVANYTSVATVSAPTFAFEFRDLTPQATYCFQIQPVNNNVMPVAPPSFAAGSPTSRPTAAPTGLRVASMANGPSGLDVASVTLQWSAPSIAVGEAPVSLYRVGFWPDDDATCLQKPQYVTCAAYTQHSRVFSTTSGVVDGLQPHTSYWFKVFAGNLNGFEGEGSLPLGPVATTRLPQPVQGLRISTVSNSSVSLEWSFQGSVHPSKLKLQYAEASLAALAVGVEELSCHEETSPCPTTKTWTGLDTGTEYTFTVLTGGPTHPLVALSSSETYSGVALISGRPYEASDAPTALTVESWTDESVRLSATLPPAETRKGPVDSLLLEGRIAAGAWTTTSVGAAVAGAVAGETLSVEVTSVGGVALARYDGTDATTYAFRLIAQNKNGNSSAATALSVKLLPPPSSPVSFERSAGTVRASALDVSWAAPTEGAAADAGFEYALEVSVDDGVSYQPAQGGPYSLSSNASSIELVGLVPLRRVRTGESYVCRLRAVNKHADSPGQPASLLLHPVDPPGAVRQLRVVAASAAMATIAWAAPEGVFLTSPVEAAVLYALQAAVWDASPVFWVLHGAFAGVAHEWASFSLSQLLAAMTAGGATVSNSTTRFLVRVLPSNAAGVSATPAPAVELVFEGLLPDAVSDLRVARVDGDQVTLEWAPYNRTEALQGYRIRYSVDGRSFFPAVDVPVSHFDQAGAWVPSDRAQVPSLPPGRAWFDMVLVGKTGQALRAQTLGPLFIPNLPEPVAGLRVAGATEHAVMLAWSQPGTPQLGWEVSVGGQAVGVTTDTSYNVSGLVAGTVYVFSVRSRSFGGLSASAQIEGSPAMPPRPPYNMQVLAAGADSVRIGWSAHAAMDAYTFQVSVAQENEDGNYALLEPAGEETDQMQRTVTGLQNGVRYTFGVQSRGLHSSGLSSAATVRFRLLDAPPAPGNLSVAFHRASSLVVEWPAAAAGSGVDFVELTVEEEGGVATTTLLLPWDAFVAEAQGLAPCTAYRLRLQACNVAGCSAAPAVEGVLTAPEQVQGLGLAAMSSTSLTLNWTAPFPARAYSYLVRYRKITAPGISFFVTEGRLVLQGGSFADVIFLSWNDQASDGAGDDTQATLSLTQDTTYQFAVIAMYEGVSSDPFYFVGTPSERPSQVLNLQVAAVLEDSLQIQWDPPSGSLVQSYQISYYQTTASAPVRETLSVGFAEANSEHDGSGTNLLAVSGLVPYALYSFEVQAVNLAGADVPLLLSALDPAPRPVPQPGRVQALRVSAATTTAVTLTWEAPPGGDAQPSFLVGMTYRVTRALVSNGTSGAHAEVTETTLAEVIVPALILGQTYEFLVTARNVNSLGYGPASSLLAGPTSPCDPSACLVRDLAVVAYSGKAGGADAVSVSIGWQAPAETPGFFAAFHYKVEYVDGQGAVHAVTSADLGPDSPHLRVTAVNGAALALGTAYTLRVTARNLNALQYGGSVEVQAEAREQPAALAAAPVLVQATRQSVTLAWPDLAPAAEASYKISFRLAGSLSAFGGAVHTQAARGTVGGLDLGAQYEFRVQQRNLHEDGFEAQGSPVLAAGPGLALSSVRNLRVQAATASSVTVAWEPPLGTLATTEYRVLIGDSASDPANTTVSEEVGRLNATASGLAAGTLYFFTVSALTVSGRSADAQTPGRPFGAATAVEGLQAKARDARNSGLSWQPPAALSPGLLPGISVAHYLVEVETPLGSGSGRFEALGSPAGTSFNHAGIDVQGVTLQYRVSAVTAQAPELGAVQQQGAAAGTALFFGSAPAFAPGTPPDGTRFVASQRRPILIPLVAAGPDLPAVGLSFRTAGSAPPLLQFSPPAPVVDAGAKTAAQNLSVAYEEALAGTEFVVCLHGEDDNGLRTATRCYTLLLPRPAPRLLSPPNQSSYVAAVGCALSVVLVAEDRTSAALAPALAAASGFAPQLALLSVRVQSAYAQRQSSQLPAGAALDTDHALTAALSNPSSTTLRWTPVKGQEGFSYRLCVVASGTAGAEAPLCLTATVERCRFCVRAGASLQAMAREWHTTWTELWSGNHLLTDPDTLAVGQAVSSGPVLGVDASEQLAQVALRYGVAVDDLLWWNPDLADPAAAALQLALVPGQALCVLPQTCLYAAAVSSHYLALDE